MHSFSVHRLRQSEIEDLHDAVGFRLDVRGLEVAMDDPLLVGRLQGFGDLPVKSSASSSAIAPFVVIRSASVAPSTSSMTSPEKGGRLLDPVNPGDVRVLERREDLRFARKPRQTCRIRRKRQ